MQGDDTPGARPSADLSDARRSPSDELINYFVSCVLESGLRHGITSGLPSQAELDSKDGCWTGRDFVDFMLAVGLTLDDAFLGLASSPCRAAASPFSSELGVLSDTLGEALDRLAQFYAIATDGLQFKLVADGRTAFVEVTPTEPTHDPHYFLPTWNIIRLVSLSQWLIGNDIPQLEVEFSHPPQVSHAAYASALGERVRFEQETNRFIFPSRLLEGRVVRSVDDLATLASEFDPEKHNYKQRSWRNILKAELRAKLHRMEALPTMEHLASQFGVSSQTLRRGLKNEGTSYRQIKTEARREVVERNISDSSLTLSELSVLAGFAETNGLARAMKSWTGQSLSEFRRSMIAGEDTSAPEKDDDEADGTA